MGQDEPQPVPESLTRTLPPSTMRNHTDIAFTSVRRLYARSDMRGTRAARGRHTLSAHAPATLLGTYTLFMLLLLPLAHQCPQVDHREQDDPYRVHEVPVERYRLGRRRPTALEDTSYAQPQQD